MATPAYLLNPLSNHLPISPSAAVLNCAEPELLKSALFSHALGPLHMLHLQLRMLFPICPPSRFLPTLHVYL